MTEPAGTVISNPTPHNHKYKTVFEISITILKKERVLLELSNKMISALAFIQQWADPTAAFISKTGNSTLPHIISKLSFPSVIFPMETDYFVFSSSAWHYAPKSPHGKVIRLSAIIGSDVEPDMIARCRPDLNAMHVGLEIKAHQNIDTNTRITLLGTPNTHQQPGSKENMLHNFSVGIENTTVRLP